MFRIKTAGFIFDIDNKYGLIEKLCSSYIIASEELRDEPYKGVFRVTEEEINRENTDGGNWSSEYLEALALYRKICEALIQNDILLFHGSVVELRGNAYIFCGTSGAGKSTHRRLWQERFGEELTVINDDKPLLKITDSEVTAYGTPFGGKENLQTNTNAPLRGFVIIRQDRENNIRRLTQKEAFPVILNQTYRRKDREGIIHTLDLTEKLSRLPVFELGCTISQEAVTLAFEALTKGTDK